MTTSACNIVLETTPPPVSTSSTINLLGEGDRSRLLINSSFTSTVSSSSSSSTTSSSASTSTRKVHIPNDVLIGLVVSRWDNILGPQCIYLWTEEKTSCFNPGNLPSHLDCLVKYVTDHTVDHHDIIVDGYLLTPATCRHTLCLVPELHLAYISLSIRVPSDPHFYNNNNNYYNGGGSSSSTFTGDYSSNNYIGGSDSNLAPSTVPHAVSILVNLNCLSQFLLMRPLVTNWLAEFGPKIAVLLCRNQLQRSMINSWCAELCKTMSTIRTCWNQQEHHSIVTKNVPVPTDNTAVNTSSNSQQQQVKKTDSIVVDDNFEEDKNHSSSSSSSRKVLMTKNSREDSTSATTNNNVQHKKSHHRHSKKKKQVDSSQWDFLPPIWPNRSSFEALLTSHLCTSNCSLIVGNDVQNINQVIKFLLCFSTSDETYCSRYVHPALPDTFMKGLFIQGLVSGEIGERSISLYHVSSNRYPLTHVDLKHKSSCKLKQSPHIQLHRQRRETILLQELGNLWNLIPFVHPVVEPFPKSVRDITAKCVSKFLNDLFMLEPDKRYGRLLLFKRSIHVKALSLITYLNSISHKPNKERNQLIKDLKDTMKLDDNEFVIIQMAAEKLRPGILSRLRSS